ncbi:hypothetical protein [Natronobacterium texcoconense]|uniref:Uncharacterized protein n=1 Tax=Natronobacterium texcoconense TaxID=1095778 RepID=A0A1H1GTD9_NATTX|nr:hypothetical protein [Natronobacterium texcoconense]SDR16419.1 hypothetical protein SAMN04489842_2598 [Natronobacterium texcoconense]
MSNETDNEVDRRTVLKAASAGVPAASVGGFASGVGAAAEGDVRIRANDASGRLISRALRSEPVKAIKRELKRPQLGNGGNSEAGVKFNPSPQDATQTTVRNANGELLIEYVSFSASEGTVHYEREHDEAYLLFDDDSAYPELIHDISPELDPVLIAADGETVFSHSVTADERREIAAVIDVRPDAVIATSDTRTEGYRVVHREDDEADDGSRTHAEAEGEANPTTRYQVDSDITEAREVVETQIAGPCPTLCLNCVSTATICGACAGMCVGVIGTGIGVTGCVLCLVHTCGTPSVICGTCVSECT